MLAVDESRPPVDRLRAGVAPLDFEVERAHAAAATQLRRHLERSRADAPPAEAVAQVELVDEGVAAVELEAPAEADDEVAGDGPVDLDQDGAPVRGIVEHAAQRRPRRALVEGHALVQIELAHQLEQRRLVRRRGRPERGLHAQILGISGSQSAGCCESSVWASQ